MPEKNKILTVYKPLGLSPLEAIDLLREKHDEYKNTPITYAGRLDPMAEGVLILLTGETIHEKENYLKLNKEYQAEIIFGFETDTYDILGFAEARKEIENLKGKISLPLPPYSSYKIKGKPLFQWAREGKLGEIEIPMRSTEIYETKIQCGREVAAKELLVEITEKIRLINGDFRQKEILAKWWEALSAANGEKFLAVKFTIACSSGTYVRSIAHNLGQRLGACAILLNLKRTKVGDFEINKSILLVN
ncbi:TPA: hypothetical protein DEW47_02885 [Patescibacteria group bacterium]|nr:MAG: tRNA pseudouridine synthase B [Parcubacteria group bacterium GW2011_GWF2_40_10]KKR47760.1 MAG: tRNA pseudouridine synthase B [Parcubacteria group bacterium GW2011_GWA2_40_143]KKR60094.1 MAG: tRNA pseudouridine synthase B [Parcubacteria group bacterium GW2011_GWC2_40_31]KKR75486.1 MAG: tRNA pseudouridine synthase B [Parcubacteria group bacterium GW2011_GWB2_40_8]KKR77695.1 MAG: tRNA pseudouridine synthase B [Parcubacteria group bacterium GW2011_GWE2_40_8]KKR83112.1 MAG: tRNA pseudouridi